MDGHYFDEVIRALTTSRRSLLGGALAVGASWLGVSVAGSKKKRKRKKRKPKAKPNAYGCLEANDPCEKADQCCSGICEGKKGKRTCQAHGAGTCEQDLSGVCSAANPELASCNNTADCFCMRTTANSIFCADEDYWGCMDCQTDRDCVAFWGMPAGSACLPYSEAICGSFCVGGSETICAAPCGTPLPEPD